jgi:hypothetical protein
VIDPLLILIIGVVDVIIIGGVVIIGLNVMGGRAKRAIETETSTYVQNRRRLAEEEAQRLNSEAIAQAKQTELSARDEALRITAEAETANKKRWGELDNERDRLDRRREEMDKRLDRLETRERDLSRP